MNIRNRNKKLVLKKFYMNILVISSHPDDEVLGMGGTIYKLANEGHKIYLCVVTDGNCGSTKQEKIRKESAIKASKFLGIKNTYFFDFPDTKLDITPQIEINKKLENLMKKLLILLLFPLMFVFLNFISPLVILYSSFPARTFDKVLFPEPFGPIIA